MKIFCQIVNHCQQRSGELKEQNWYFTQAYILVSLTLLGQDNLNLILNPSDILFLELKFFICFFRLIDTCILSKFDQNDIQSWKQYLLTSELNYSPHVTLISEWYFQFSSQISCFKKLEVQHKLKFWMFPIKIWISK